MNKPVLLLAFANEREEGRRYLRNLPLEMNRLRATLEKAEDKGLCELVILPNTTLDTLIETFQREKYRNRIAIFHYGGHAGSYELLLEQASGKTQLAHGDGLVPFLAGQKGLQLVFLNGCHSARQAEALLNNGIPAVVGTVSAVDDRIATELSAAFYKALGEGAALEQAWQEATYKIKASEGAQHLNHYYQQASPAPGSRDVVLSLDEPRDQFPWQIHYREGSEAARDWNLPDAANDPYFGLPEIPPRYSFPEEPYRFLQRYTREDARIFFGRGHYIRDLYHRIHSPQAAPAILLYGQSGVGKSSLLEAGLFPRLEEDYDIRFFRRQPETGLLGHLANALGLPDGEAEAAKLLQQWKRLEAQSEKKGLLIVLDQVEEVFTRPAEGQPEELQAFLQTVSAIFSRLDERPAGKLLLSYRKEYDPEIEKACRAASLPKEKVFLERLDRKGILEISGGLASNQQLQNKYRLDIEKGLPVLIADDLLEDRNSPIAPVLQIILTKLWQQQENLDKRLFRAEDYQKLKKEGILLDDFFHQQMAQIRAWEEDIEQRVESSGLALDVLHYHTTALGTAESRSLETLRTHYQHQSDILQKLLHQLQSLYLLAGLGPEQTALAHDTLAPIVQREIRDSDKPGQRALRILSSKVADYEISSERTYIDEEDLALVEEGAGGMRMWTGKERELVEKSRDRRFRLVRERKRNRKLKIAGVIAITILAIITSILGYQSHRQAQKEVVKARVSTLVSQALREEKLDATQALATVDSALALLPNDEYTLQVRHEIYSNNEFYEKHLKLEEKANKVVFSPNGNLILSVSGNILSIWNIDEPGRTPKQKILHPGPLDGAIFSPDGSQILSFGNDSIARLWDIGGQMIRTLEGHRSLVLSAAYQPVTGHILTGSLDGELILWEKGHNKILRRWPAHEERIYDLAYSPSGDTMVTASRDQSLALWTTEGRLIRRIFIGSLLTSVAWDPLGKNIISASRDGKLRFHSLNGGEAMSIQAHNVRANCAAYSPDGRLILSASDDRQIKLWNRQGELLRTYKGHREEVRGLDFSTDGKHFVSAGWDRTIKFWPLASKEIQRYDHAGQVVSSLAFAPDGRFITGVGTRLMEIDISDPNISDEEVIRLYAEPESMPAMIWDKLGRQIHRLEKHASYITAVDCSSSGEYYLTGSGDHLVIRWDTAGKAIQSYIGMKDVVKSACFSRSGQLVAAGGMDSTAIVWNINGKQLFALPHPAAVSSLSFSPDDKLLLTGCYDGYARIWPLDTKQASDTFSVAGERVVAACFSPDGRYIALGSGAGEAGVYVWALDGRLLFHQKIPAQNEMGGQAVNSLVFHPDGKYIAAAAEGGMVKIYDLSGRELHTINDTNGADANCIAFSPDGAFLLVGSGNGWVRKYRPLGY